MNLISKRTIKNLLQRYQIRPSKRLGQNFLIDEGVIKRVIEAAQLSQNDIVLEIGPGIGNLTMELAKRVKKVIAIEKDLKMIEILKETLKEFENVEIIQGDILKIGLKSKILNLKSYKVVANLPFYITAPVIRKFLETRVKPWLLVLVAQKEVAQRICAKAPDMTRSTSSGSSRTSRGMSILAVSVQFYAEPKIISYISKKSFWPSPKVDSAIIKIVPRQFRVPVSRQFRERFFRIVKAGFSQPRKQLINNLSRKLRIDKMKIESWLQKNNIQPNQRAETLNIEDWINLTKSFKI